MRTGRPDRIAPCRNLDEASAHSCARDAGEPRPAQYHRLFQIWFILGWPAFAGVIAIFVLMIAKPPL
jgi:uncharacterized membrane protein